MNGNRYRHSNMQDVWDSFEWLYRQKLEELDHMTRQMIREMSYPGCDVVRIHEFVREQFADLWENVARQQEELTPDPRGRPSAGRLTPS